MFHAIDPADNMFCHNIALSKGSLTAISLAREVHPEWNGMVSPYEAFTREKDKEAAFESIRSAHYPMCPSRLGAIFLFPTRAAADCANEHWWGNRRVILSATIAFAVRVGEFDAKLLDAKNEQWEVSAKRYWSGERTADPAPEVLLHGIAQLEGWEPYARLFGMLSNK